VTRPRAPRWGRAIGALALTALITATLTPTAAVAARPRIPTPKVTGPIAGGIHDRPFMASALPLDALYDYGEEEFFIEGRASAYTSDVPLSTDGLWNVSRARTADYKTRLLVRTPHDKRHFNGTVVVEWLNVSVGFDTTPEWAVTHDQLMEEGYAWVGVSAQAVGVNGTGNAGSIGGSLKAWDPQRYGSLIHPGDSFSYDIFSQAGAVLRQGSGSKALGGLRIKHLIAVGESQSAFRLTTYLNAFAPRADVYDGYMVHSRGGGAPALSQAPEADVPAPTGTRIRDDLDVPVLVYQAENDLTWLNYYAARQPDNPFLRIWEVAGTPHADRYHLAFDTDVDPQLALPTARPTECGLPINDGPNTEVLNGAYRALTDWVVDGVVPTQADRIQMDATGGTPTIVRDRFGIAKGGVRTPDVDVPVATHSGEGNTCIDAGTTIPFTADQIADLYPSSYEYVSQVTASATEAARKGFILPGGAKEMIDEATWFRLGRADAGCCDWVR
jgi:hypothetical protein